MISSSTARDGVVSLKNPLGVCVCIAKSWRGNNCWYCWEYGSRLYEKMLVMWYVKLSGRDMGGLGGRRSQRCSFAFFLGRLQD